MLLRSVIPISLLFSIPVLVAAPNPVDAYDKSAFIAPEGKAVFVFVQNEPQDRKLEFTVFAGDKRCVALVRGRQAEVLPVEPVPYVLYVLGYNETRRIELYPEAGRTYFVRLHTQKKVVGDVPEVTLVRRASEEHMELRFHLQGAQITHATADEECYGKPLKERSNRTQRRINEGNGDWKNADDAYRDEYRLIEKDGLTKEDIGRL